MEELLELKELLLHGEVENALMLVEDMEEIGKKGIENNIRSLVKVLLIYFIKQEIEQRTTKSWNVYVRNCQTEIEYINTRPKGKGYYLNDEELREVISSSINVAINYASLEVEEGIHHSQRIREMIDESEIISRALMLVKTDEY